MRKVIRADLRRIFRKPAFYILLVILIVMQTLSIATVSDKAVEEIITDAKNKFEITYLIFVTIYIYLQVIADDRKSNAWAYDIGIGLDRGKLLFAKVIDFAVLNGVMYLVLGSLRLILYVVFDMPLSKRQLSMIAVWVVFQLLHGVSVLILSMLADIVSGSTSLGILTDVVLVMFFGMGFLLLGAMYNINLYDYTINGLLSNAFSNLSAGRMPWQLIPAVGVYLVLAFAAAVAVFNKKELQL